MARQETSAWDVKLSAEKREDFTEWICNQITNALDARSVPIPDVRYWWTLYEQGRTRTNEPFQDAADLTSYLGTEKVDALRARIMRTVMVDPVWTVEGWGQSAKKAPFVEEFHQWQLEAEGLQAFLSRVIHASLIEPRGVLEVYENTTERVVRKEIQAKVALTPDGQFMLDAQMQPVLEQDEDGNFVEVVDDEGGTVATAATVIDVRERVRTGPAYRVLSYENFLVLPAHAREKSDIYGYAKRFTKRWSEIQEQVKAKVYDKTAVEEMTDAPDVVSEERPDGSPVIVDPQEGPTAEKELWEVQFLYDFNGKGLRWYVATVHVGMRKLLRLKHDSVAHGRFILFVPFPRTDRSHEGYSFIGNKLITVIEEHTAWRNMTADRAAMENAAPIKRLTGALWDPDDVPWGPNAVIDVRDMNEVQAMTVPSLTGATVERERDVVQASERLAGINDVALGQAPQGSQTLGEVNLVAEQSFVRMDEVIKNLQEALEDLGQVRHAIWLNTLKESKGMDAPQALLVGIEARGGDVMHETPAVTPDMLEGVFRFKPRGSTESADITRQRGDYIQFMQALPILLSIWPAMAQVLGQNTEAAKSSLEQMVRLFRMPDKQAWIGNTSQWEAMTAPQVPQGAPGMPGMPGAPPGGAPSGGMPPGLPPQLAAMLGGGGPPQGA